MFFDAFGWQPPAVLMNSPNTEWSFQHNIWCLSSVTTQSPVSHSYDNYEPFSPLQVQVRNSLSMASLFLRQVGVY